MGEATFVQLDGDAVNAAGAQYAAAGAQFTAQGSSAAADIEAAEAGEPWGHDKYGHAFLESYGDPKAGDDSLEFLNNGGQQSNDVGNAVSWAAVDGIDADSQAKQDINSLNTEKTAKNTGGGSTPTGTGTATNASSSSPSASSSSAASSSPASASSQPAAGGNNQAMFLAEASETTTDAHSKGGGKLTLSPVDDGPMMTLQEVVDGTTQTAQDGDQRIVREVYKKGVGWVDEKLDAPASDTAKGVGDRLGPDEVYRRGEGWVTESGSRHHHGDSAGDFRPHDGDQRIMQQAYDERRGWVSEAQLPPDQLRLVDGHLQLAPMHHHADSGVHPDDQSTDGSDQHHNHHGNQHHGHHDRSASDGSHDDHRDQHHRRREHRAGQT